MNVKKEAYEAVAEYLRLRANSISCDLEINRKHINRLARDQRKLKEKKQAIFNVIRLMKVEYERDAFGALKPRNSGE